MELQIPYSVRTEVQAAGDIWEDPDRDRQDTEGAMPEERHRDSGGGSVPGSYTYACIDTAEIQRVERDGVSEGEEQPDDIRPVRKPEV